MECKELMVKCEVWSVKCGVVSSVEREVKC